MYFMGLHLLDWLIVFGYFIGMILIGKWAQAKIKNSRDFYQGGRSFGKIIFAFLMFGNITSADQAAGVTREIYRQGLQGMWFQNLVLFHTPFQWFSAILQRRARYLGPGDIYLHRFESKFLAGLFAGFILINAIFGNSFGYLLTGKTIEALMVKQESEYTPTEREMIAGFFEMKALEKKASFGEMSPDEKDRLEVLHEKEKRGEIKAYVSHINLVIFYFLYAGVVGAYVIMGGLFAAAVTDIIQGLLIIFLSVALIPIGLKLLGGFSGLHAKVPMEKFLLFGSDVSSEYTWYFVAALVTLNLVVNAPRMFTIGGSARDDRSARLGFVGGALVKRFIMIGWALAGLIAIGLYSGTVSDPTNIWGHMTRSLLGVGFIGVMVASIFAANMSTISGASLEWGAAFTHNILVPLRPQTSEGTQILAGRIVIFVVLGGSIYFAHVLNDVFVIFKYILSILTVIGPSMWLVYFWRRLNTRAVATQMMLSILITIVVPNVVPIIPGMRENPHLTIQTEVRSEIAQTKALQEDVDAGRATHVGQPIEKVKTAPPTGIFYETVVRKDPTDPNSVLVGQGLFRVQVYLVSLLGVDMTKWSKAQVSTAGVVFDIFFPFFVLILVSFLTKRNSEKVLREFYAAVHTPAVADPIEDEKRVRAAIDDPGIVERDKVFPGTDWEFWKPTKWDIWGFIICWLFVFFVISLYWIVSRIGA